MIAMTPAIVSRCRIFAFEPLTQAHVESAVMRAVCDEERGLGKMHVEIDEDALRHIARIANGDVRTALNAVELAALTTPTVGGVIRGRETLLPSRELQLAEGDKVVIFTLPKSMSAMVKLFE
jgi:replication-associated recombination protein RarA